MKKLAKKPRIGRPPLENRNDLRDRWLNDVRFSASELARLKAQAERVGQRWSDWVRARLGL